MKLHPRHVPVEQARRELTDFVLDWTRRHGLTLPEELMLLAEELHRTLALTVKHERQEEAKPCGSPGSGDA